MGKNLHLTKLRKSDQALPVPWPFVISRFHCNKLLRQFISCNSSQVFRNFKTACVLVILMFLIGWLSKRAGANRGLFYVTFLGKLPTYASPKPSNINAYFSLGAKCWLRGGVGGQFPRNVKWSGNSCFDAMRELSRRGKLNGWFRKELSLKTIFFVAKEVEKTAITLREISLINFYKLWLRFREYYW